MKSLALQTKTKLLSLLLLCCALLLWLPGTCSAETMYNITESELTQLDQNLAQLAQNNEKLIKDYSESQKDLVLAQSNLEELRATLEQCKIDLALTKQHSLAAQKSLQTANESLDKYEHAVKSEIRTLKLQRDIGYIGILLVVLGKR